MRSILSIGAILAAGLLVTGVGVTPAAAEQPNLVDQGSEPSVDVELVIAVDITLSRKEEEIAAQREAYAQAIVSEEFLQALRSGPLGKISVTYFEWSAKDDQQVVVPWRVIDGRETADAVAREMRRTPVRVGSQTSISTAIRFATTLFDRNENRGLRRVIDISGDGPNNNGPPVAPAREEALGRGIIINGVPIMIRTHLGALDIDNLDEFYEDCIIGGPGSFMVAIKDRDKFKDVIRTTLLREVAEQRQQQEAAPAKAPRVSCMIGEKLWNDRWGIR